MADELQDGTEMVPTPSMTRRQQTVWIVGTLILLGAGGFWYSSRLPEGHPNKECQGLIFMDDRCLASLFVKQMTGVTLDGEEELLPAEEAMPADDVATSAVAAGDAAAATAMDETDAILGRADGSSALADPELEMGSRQAVELNDMICSQTGQNCNAAKMARRHHVERYGRF